jgi:threonine synthase
MTTLTHLECARCRTTFDPGQVRNSCDCGGPLLARYDLKLARESWSREWIASGPSTIWRYAPVLPVRKPASIVSLGEGMTPLVHTRRIGDSLGVPDLWIKDEGLNPTGSFKARGFSCAVSMAVELGITKTVIYSSGNAAGALAAYAAAAGIEAGVSIPRSAPQSNYIECRAFGASTEPVEGGFDMGAFREPYRVEGIKTMAYELAEQMGWRLPGAVLFPTGGGAGLAGIWKGFAELEELGWISGKRPKMIAVQAQGCAPIERAFEQGRDRSETWENAWTVASGLCVPNPPGDFLVLEALRASGGTAVAVSDTELLDAGGELASAEGVFVAPEGAAALAALRKLIESGAVGRDERIVIMNTGSGLKYLDSYATRFPRQAASEQDKLGGLITPR